MKEILSYCDLLLGLLAIGFSIFRMYKYSIYAKKRDNYMQRKASGRRKISYSRHIENRFEYLICNIFIVFGVLFIYNRLKGNLPNIIILIKDIIGPY